MVAVKGKGTVMGRARGRASDEVKGTRYKVQEVNVVSLPKTSLVL